MIVKKIAVLTSGGDAPAMNSCIRSINRCCTKNNMELIGVIGGYKGLYEGHFQPLNLEMTSGIHSLSGTILKSSRFEAFKEDHVVKAALSKVRKEGIEGIIVIGGDGSYKGAMSLERLGMPCIGIPGTIDNDIPGTQYTIGFNTALTTIVESIDALRSTAKSHRRCLILEVMGRDCADLAVYGGIAGDVTAILSSDEDQDFDRLDTLVKTSIKQNGEAIILVREHVLDVFALAKRLEKETQIECRAMILSYLQRGGQPTVSDRILATRFGIKAVEALMDHQSGVCTCIQNDEIVLMPIEQALTVSYHNRGIYEDEYKLR